MIVRRTNSELDNGKTYKPIRIVLCPHQRSLSKNITRIPSLGWTGNRRTLWDLITSWIGSYTVLWPWMRPFWGFGNNTMRIKGSFLKVHHNRKIGITSNLRSSSSPWTERSIEGRGRDFLSCPVLRPFMQSICFVFPFRNSALSASPLRQFPRNWHSEWN